MKQLLLLVFAVASVFAIATPAQAQVQWGVRAGLYLDNTDPFVGVEAIMPISRDLFFNPNVEYAGGDTELLTLNADVHYDLIGAGKNMLWVGAGVAALIADSDSDFGVNLFAGIGTRWKGMVPYAQAKAVIGGDNDQGVLGVGLRF
jgi:hypothetical protein